MAYCRVSGLEEDCDHNGVVGRAAGEAYGGLSILRVSQGTAVLVDDEHCEGVAYTALPPEMVFDAESRKTVRNTRPRRYVTFNDSDGDDIIFEAWEGRGAARYCVNCVWREDFSSAEFFLDGREGWDFPHVRLDCGVRYRNVQIPRELGEKLKALFNFAKVPHSAQEYAPGDHVTLLRGVAFADGDAIAEGTRAVVLQRTSDTEFEVVIANGDRMDVPTHHLAPAPRLMPSDAACLERAVEFQSARPSVERGTFVTVKGTGKVKGTVEVQVDSEASKEFTFDVSELWLRRLEGDILM